MSPFKTFLPKFIILITAVLVFACNDEPADTTKPVISAVNSPLAGDTLFSGTDLTIIYTVSDDHSLSQLKAQIKALVETDIPLNEDSISHWEYISISNLTENGTNNQFSIPIPLNVAAGNYVLEITAIDASGNVSEMITAPFVIRNPTDLIAPTIEIYSPAPGEIFFPGLNVLISGMITDNTEVSLLQTSVLQGAEPIFESSEEIWDPSYEINLEMPTDTTMHGDFVLKVTAYDRVFNSSTVLVPFVLQ